MREGPSEAYRSYRYIHHPAGTTTYRLGISSATVGGGLSIYTMFVTEARSGLGTFAVRSEVEREVVMCVCELRSLLCSPLGRLGLIILFRHGNFLDRRERVQWARG